MNTLLTAILANLKSALRAFSLAALLPLSAWAQPNYTDLWWNEKESGWGIMLNHQSDIVFAPWFTYGIDGKARWYVVEARLQADGSYLGPVYQTTGIPFNLINGQPSSTSVISVGSASLRFGDNHSGTFASTIGGVVQTKSITRQAFAATPTTCSAQASTVSRASAQNYQDLWWTPAEAGWGVSLAHQGDLLFATWFTYAADGSAQWLVGSSLPRRSDGSYGGLAYRTTGTPRQQIDGQASLQSAVAVGDFTFRFSDGERGVMSYTLDGVVGTKNIVRQVFGSSVPLCSNPTSTRSVPKTLRIVATPNPNVFPLLLAMARQPTLAATLVPIADGSQIDTTFAAANADAVLGMTYTIAKKVVTNRVPDLQLLRVNLWRGFGEVAPSQLAITHFSQLVGKGLLVSGPTSGGKGGGPDLIFQAAIKRAGYGVADFKICYLPVLEAAPMISQQQKMNSNAACDASFDMAPSAISLVEPAATGLVLQTLMPTTASSIPLQRAIDYQTLFSGYRAWPTNQLPHGGMAALGAVLDDPARQATLRAVLAAYDAAVQEIATANTIRKRSEIAQIVSEGITKYYGAFGLDLPAPVILFALSQGELIIRGDLGLAQIQPDLHAFLTEVAGAAPAAKFYRTQGF